MTVSEQLQAPESADFEGVHGGHGSHPTGRVTATPPTGGGSEYPLHTWLADLHRRQLNVRRSETGDLAFSGWATPDDRVQLARHRHALETAAQGTHPAWWNHVLGRTHRLSADNMPVVNDPRDQLTGTGWPCACCGHPADIVSPDALPWCQEHA